MAWALVVDDARLSRRRGVGYGVVVTLSVCHARTQDDCMTGPLFSYNLRYIVGFGLVEMAISTNPKPTIYPNLYENTGLVVCEAYMHSVLDFRLHLQI